MAERQHIVDGGQTRYWFNAFKVWVDAGLMLHVAWGGESSREYLRRKSNNWWNPFSWGTEWVRDGAAGPGMSVQVFNARGLEVSTSLGPPKTVDETGYFKKEWFLHFWGSPRPIGPDARDIRRVKVTYNVPGVGPQELEQT